MAAVPAATCSGKLLLGVPSCFLAGCSRNSPQKPSIHRGPWISDIPERSPCWTTLAWLRCPVLKILYCATLYHTDIYSRCHKVSYRGCRFPASLGTCRGGLPWPCFRGRPQSAAVEERSQGNLAKDAVPSKEQNAAPLFVRVYRISRTCAMICSEPWNAMEYNFHVSTSPCHANSRANHSTVANSIQGKSLYKALRPGDTL